MNRPCTLNQSLNSTARVASTQLAGARRKNYASTEARSARREELRAKLEARRTQANVPAPMEAISASPEPSTSASACVTTEQRYELKQPVLAVQRTNSLRTTFKAQAETLAAEPIATRSKYAAFRVTALGQEALHRFRSFMEKRSTIVGCAVGVGVAVGVFAPEIAAAGVAVKLACVVGAGVAASVGFTAAQNWLEVAAAVQRGAQAAPSSLVASGIASLACLALGLSGPAAWPVILGGGALGAYFGDDLVQGGMGCFDAAWVVGKKGAAVGSIACVAAGCGIYLGGAAA